MLDESGLRIGGILTDLFGLSGRNLLDGLLEGREPEQMVTGVRRQWKVLTPVSTCEWCAGPTMPSGDHRGTPWRCDQTMHDPQRVTER